MKNKRIGYSQTILEDPIAMSHVWEVRKAGLGLLLSRRTYSRAIGFIEDLTIPPEHLAPFMDKFISYLKSKGKQAGIYGHVGSGCMHVRPYINLRDQNDAELMHQMMLEVSDLVLEYGGALSGEHGDGWIRSWLNKKMFGEKIYQAFLEIKAAFDPDNLMNPGKIVQAPSPLENLRAGPETTLTKIKTFLDFAPEGGFELAVDLCNGNGMCRKKETLMCPSFQVSNDEYDTTRARAQALRAIVNGRLSTDYLASQEIFDVLDLCIECKGCKTECPSQVDMAKMKAEFLYHYQNKHGISFRNWLFGNIGTLYQIMPYFPRFIKAPKWLLGFLGIATEREMPSFASQTFSKTFKKTVENSNQVVLFNDTFNEFHNPEIGLAAVQILKKMGYDPIVPSWQCCGRPLISKGILKKAQTQAFNLAKQLMKYAEHGMQIIGLEPSCILTIKEDYPSLLNHLWNKNLPPLQILKDACKTFDEFVADHLQNGKLPFNLPSKECVIQVHGHCHQKSLIGMQPTMQVLKAIPGAKIQEIDSGCCGMAGSFGYEKEHYDFSMKIGELKLFPAIRSAKSDSILIANGFSCRNQILHGTGKQSKHLSQVLI